jgi:cytochrome P450
MTANASSGTVPVSDLDPYTDAALLDPWPVYRLLRDAGPAVWLPQYKMFALTRHASVRAALRDSSTFASAYGVMMNEPMNQVLRGNTLCSDSADHDALRRVVIKPLRPQALSELTEQIMREADELVERVVAQGSFGPLNERTVSAFPVVQEMVEYATTQAVRGKLKPASWGERCTTRPTVGRSPGGGAGADGRLCRSQLGHHDLRDHQRRMAVRPAP